MGVEKSALCLLSDRRVELADMKTVVCYVEDLRDLLGQSCFTQKKSFVKSFVRRVKVTGSEVTINYTIPMPFGSISERVTSVPPIVHNGGR